MWALMTLASITTIFMRTCGHAQCCGPCSVLARQPWEALFQPNSRTIRQAEAQANHSSQGLCRERAKTSCRLQPQALYEQNETHKFFHT
eukprot:4512527-Amphidinium_carterae.1